MKSQCNTSAECLRELARVMDQFGIDDPLIACKSKYVLFLDGAWLENNLPAFSVTKNWQFAIAEVEGKPVFIGDELYCNDIKIVAAKKDTGFKLNHLSWNPPKPKTVMVELTVENAKFWASLSVVDVAKAERGLVAACKTALEKLK